MSDNGGNSEKLWKDLIELKFPEPTSLRLQHLMDRNNEGALTTAERRELAALVEFSELLSLLRARAMKALQQRPPTLEQLLEGITDENLHPEFDTGRPVGREVW